MLNYLTGDKFVQNRVKKEMDRYKKELGKKMGQYKLWKAELIENLYTRR
ncbi:MAG: hypothetical protein ACOY3J_04635 [Bacillota bacterium]|uniref:Uncharacterized protein n=1 Tax=Thermanaerosceptrum fracticalcis TaxID=1712410 RepID=A0A7G6E2A6_THEFR|nr:hypothetical protein [Thermanaerosceptrum fracticalcis]QNB46210.1 hypothetical protein BR63_07725 [Thermanaerosceptrum fracticalcis]